MMFPSERDGTPTGHERPKKSLHNFRFPSWGVQQSMRCVKVEPHGGGSGDSEEEGIEEFREKMMLDIRTVKESIFREHDVRDYEEEEEEHTTKEKYKSEEAKKEKEREPVDEVKRWNLRKRRGDCEAPFIELGFVEEKVNTSSVRCTIVSTLSRKEVEDDMMMMIGPRPPRRPKKRLRAVQKKINLLHPAFYFSEVTEDIYYPAEKGKR